MSLPYDRPYERTGNTRSDQAEPSTINPGAANTQMRILIELQVISMLLREGMGIADDLARMRQNVSDSIT